MAALDLCTTFTEDDDDEQIDSDWEKALSAGSSAYSAKVFACPYSKCAKYFSKRSRLNVHIRCHTGERPYKCSEKGCEASYTRSSHLQRHVQSAHNGSKSFKCTNCFTNFITDEALKKHLRVMHGADNRFECKECKKSFPKRNSLTNHVATVHLGQLPHGCHLCDKRFKYPNKLRRHLEKHARVHKCGDCDKEFRNFHQLRTHRAKAHPKVHKCSICSFRFSGKSNYITHLKTHEIQREVFHCPIDACGRTFCNFSNLKNHAKVHHDGVRFFCPKDDCSQSFTSRRRLAVHLSNHDREQPQPSLPRGSNSRERIDKGKFKKSMATFLSNVDIGPEGEKILLQDKETPLKMDQMMEKLKENQSIMRELENESEGEKEEDLLPTMELCHRANCNQQKKIQGILKDIEIFEKSPADLFSKCVNT